MTHRLSSLVLDDSKRGFGRFTREFLGTLICPMRGINRMITGDMWKVKRSHYKYHDYERIPINSLSVPVTATWQITITFFAESTIPIWNFEQSTATLSIK